MYISLILPEVNYKIIDQCPIISGNWKGQGLGCKRAKPHCNPPTPPNAFPSELKNFIHPQKDQTKKKQNKNKTKTQKNHKTTKKPKKQNKNPLAT